MGDEQVQSLQTTQHPVATGVPVLFKRVEDINPTVVESMVSVLMIENNFIILFCCSVWPWGQFYGEMCFSFAFFIIAVH
jgi:hypothetical protein